MNNNRNNGRKTICFLLDANKNIQGYTLLNDIMGQPIQTPFSLNGAERYLHLEMKMIDLLSTKINKINS